MDYHSIIQASHSIYNSVCMYHFNKLKINYRKNKKNSDTGKNCCKYPKIGTVLFDYRVIGPKDADGMANSVDPDHTAPRGAV